MRNLWASPALFVTASLTAFVVVRSDAAIRAGWLFYFAGWVPPLIALAACAGRGERPGVGGVFALAVLALFGILFWLNHG